MFTSELFEEIVENVQIEETEERKLKEILISHDGEFLCDDMEE